MPKKYSRLAAMLMAALIALGGLTGCSTGNSTAGTAAVTAATAADGLAPITVQYSSEDLDSTWDAGPATAVALQGDSIAVTGAGAAVKGSTLTITAAGTYVLSGALNDGQIIVDAGKNDHVRLVLNGASLSCSDGPAIYAKQAEKTILVLAPGSHNTVSDGAAYILAGEDDPDAAIFSQDDLTVNGAGSLIVNGQYNHGIATKDNLVITGGNITVTAAGDGLRGRDSIAVKDGVITIDAGGDGLQANNDEDADKGWISLDGGVFTITAGEDGVQAKTVLQVTGGKFTLTTGGGSANASAGAGGEPRSEWGQRQTTAPENVNTEDNVSAKGLKASGSIYISGGTTDIDSSDDSVHSNGEILIKESVLTISSGDDGIHADSALRVDGGEILISQSYEGLESAAITINGGTIRVTSKDDGFNAAGGNDGSAMGGRPGENSFKSDSAYFIRITGGYISINSGGDGIDSNGALYFNGGTVTVSGPTSNNNGPLDYNGACEVTGGILAIAGSSGMAQSPGTSSSQNSITVTYRTAQAAGTMAALTDDSGNTVLAFAPAKTYQSIVFSSPLLEKGKTYTLVSGGTCSGQLTDGLYTGGACSGGAELAKITVSDTVTRVADDGSAVTGGIGGPGGWGGNKAPPAQPR